MSSFPYAISTPDLDARGSLIRVEVALRFIKERISGSPTDLRSFLGANGIELTGAELLAVSDVLDGTSTSPFNRVPAGATIDKMQDLRKVFGPLQDLAEC